MLVPLVATVPPCGIGANSKKHFLELFFQTTNAPPSATKVRCRLRRRYWLFPVTVTDCHAPLIVIGWMTDHVVIEFHVQHIVEIRVRFCERRRDLVRVLNQVHIHPHRADWFDPVDLSLQSCLRQDDRYGTPPMVASRDPCCAEPGSAIEMAARKDGRFLSCRPCTSAPARERHVAAG
jgi:hypothetical protein